MTTEETEAAPEVTKLSITTAGSGSSENLGVRQEKCTKNGCTLEAFQKDQQAWEELWAGRIDPANNPAPPDQSAETSPSAADFEAAMNAIRPEGSKKHALMTIRQQWNDVVKDNLETVKADLDAAFKKLEPEWQGKDFEEFRKRYEATIKFVDDIVVVVAGESRDGMNPSPDNIMYSLKDYSDTLADKQTNCPFPAAKIWSYEETDGTNEDRVHIRPPWTPGNCKDKSLEEAAKILVNGMENAGSEFRSLEQQWQTHFKQTECTGADHRSFWMGDEDIKTGTSCKTLPPEEQRSDAEAKEISNRYISSMARDMKDEVLEDYEGKYKEVYDEIIERRDGANTTYTDSHPKIDPNKAPPPNTPGQDGGSTPPPGLGTPPGSTPPSGTLPDTPKMDPPPGYTPPPTDSNIPDYDTDTPTTPDITNPTKPDDYGGLESGGGNLGGIGGGGGGIGNPGGIGGGGGGIGAPGGGAGAGGGGLGGAGMVGAGAGMGRGAGAAGAGKGGGGRGGMGMMGGGAGAGGAGKGAAGKGGAGMMGGGAGRGGALGNENEEHGTWLTEDDDVWGTDGDDAPPSLLR